MKQNTVKVKERYNWPVTILLIIGIVLVILLPLYMALMIAIKDPTDMNNILALPRKIRLQNFADAWVMTNFPRKFLNTYWASCSVCWLSSLNSTNGMVKSFQVHMKERIATVAVVGFRTGKMILEKI